MTPPGAGWQEAFASLTPVFGAVLKRLRRSGLLHTANEGLDVLHDFVTDVLPSVAERVDLSDPSSHGYLAVAFSRFATRQLVRERKLQWLLDSDESTPLSVEPPVDSAIDGRRLAQALSVLADGDRDVLQRYLADDKPSVRALASALGISRHTAHQRLLKALAAFVATVREHPMLSESDLEVARAVFVDEWPSELAAARLHLSEARVRAARARVLKAVEASLHASGATS